MSLLIDLASGRKLRVGDALRDELGRQWEVLGWTDDGEVFVRLRAAESAVLRFDIDRFGLVIQELVPGVG
ncbi:hypothetical protein [Chitinimonas sp.]|uniref:hypothetical protein n=1 Tax=Chitinimonas sp. TaxID=1934313 RepID=UPI0035B301AA